jgi:hypothetical protein
MSGGYSASYLEYLNLLILHHIHKCQYCTPLPSAETSGRGRRRTYLLFDIFGPFAIRHLI